MPEGPSIVILKELIDSLHLEGELVVAVNGNTKIDKERMLRQRVTVFKSWGKHFLICFKDFTLRIHFMMFGTYRINERKTSPARLTLSFKKGELNFYTCSLQYIEGDLSRSYDWSADVMSQEWDPKKASKKLKAKPEALICDLLLDQQIFSGVGNIIKNEVLYRVGIHPLSSVKAIPLAKLKLLITEARQYSFDFLKWKKAYVLKQHWLVNTRKFCPLKHPLEKGYLGMTKRRTFYCTMCQKLYILRRSLHATASIIRAAKLLLESGAQVPALRRLWKLPLKAARILPTVADGDHKYSWSYTGLLFK